MKTQTLEEAVAAAAETVTDWRAKIASIEEKIAAEDRAIAIAKQHREQHALAATLGDANAIAAIKKARSEQLNAEQILADLRIALPAAAAELVAAEKAAESARRALAKLQAEEIMRKRIEVAAELDVAVATVARLYGDYEKLGREIVNMPDILPRSVAGVSNFEAAIGARRVRASLPAFFWRLFPGAINDEMKQESLATSEARFWNLPPVETATTEGRMKQSAA
jgi:hypothetical protein